jgi:hypothetical protein
MVERTINLSDIKIQSKGERMWFHRLGSCLLRGEWPAHWEPQEEGMMSIAASFPSVKKPRFIIQERKADNVTEGDAC